MNESKVCSNALKNWLLAKNFSAFLLALVISCSIVLVSPSLTAYARVYIVDGVSSAIYTIEQSKSYVETIDSYLMENEYALKEYRIYISGPNHMFVYSSSSPITCDSESWAGGVYVDVHDVYMFTLPSSGSITFEEATLDKEAKDYSYASYGYFVFATTKDLYSPDGNFVMSATTDFFPKPPILITKVAGMEMNPLGQIVGLLPLLIPCLAGLVAFSKGWRFLLSILRKA